MKNLFTSLWCCMVSVSAMAQNHDMVWFTGYENNPANQDFGGGVIDFRQNPPNIYYHYRPMNFTHTSTVMCDASGHLIFYTNGVYIADSTDQPMLGGDTLSPSPDAFQADFGIFQQQSVLALPRPGDSMRYDLFHADNKDWAGPGRTGLHLYHSEIDMRGNNALGEVTSLNDLILSDTLDGGKLTACRHANGRDWWIVAPAQFGNEFYVYLLSPQSVVLSHHVQNGIPLPIPTGVGQALFSPDGTKYVIGDGTGGGFDSEINIYDFNRCDGTFENRVQIFFSDSDSLFGMCPSVSPNSRFLYVSCGFFVYQYDLQAPDIGLSKVTVAIWDGFLDLGIIPSSFFLSQLGPDGAIYISTGTGTHFMHRIENPDLPGFSCNVQQRYFTLPTWNAGTIPNHPNYRLGPIDGSPCDTLGIDANPVFQPQLNEWALPIVDAYPNPATTSCTIGMGRALPQDGRMEVHDMGGRLVEAHALHPATIGYGLNTSTWPAGIYVATVWCGGEVWGSVQILIEN